MRSYKRSYFYIILLASLAWLASSCQAASSLLSKPTVTPTPSLTATATAAPTTTFTPTPQPPLAVLLAPPGANEVTVNLLQTSLNEIVTGQGLRWQVRQSLSPTDLVPGLRLVVALPPDPGVAGLAAASPDTQYLAVGIAGLELAANITLLDTAGGRPDRQGFIAGVVAAMLAPDWRVGAISISDTIEGRAARTGFLNGVEYFCGLCRPLHPPYYEYPIYFELPLSATAPEWQEAANYMVDHFVQAVYIFPGAGDEGMLAVLASAGVNIISSGTPPEVASANWVLSLDSDPLSVIQNQVKGLLDGSLSGGQALFVPFQFTHINPALLSPGKQRLADEVLSDLHNDRIDTSVDLTTGEYRP